MRVNTCSFELIVQDVPRFGPQRLPVTGELVIDFDGEDIRDLLLLTKKNFTDTFDSPGLQRVPDWTIILSEGFEIDGSSFMESFESPLNVFGKDSVWFWRDSNAEEWANLLHQAYQNDNWTILTNTGFKVNPPGTGFSRDMLAQFGLDYQGISLSPTKRLSPRWLCNGSFPDVGEEFGLEVDRNLAAHFPDTGPGFARAYLRMTEVETPKIPVTDPNSSVDYLFLFEDSSVTREYVEFFGANLTGNFLGTGSQNQGACNHSSTIGRIDIACSHNVPNATAFTLNVDMGPGRVEEIFRLLLNGQTTFSTSIRESDDVDISATQLSLREERGFVKIHNVASSDGLIGAQVLRLPLDPKF